MRSEVDREEKIRAILDAAKKQLRSMVGLARELGLAQAAINWYFPSKDDLFVATLGRMLEKTFSEKPRHRPKLETSCG